MCSIMDLIRPELSELYALEFAKIAESDFVYTLASTNVDQLVSNMVTIIYEDEVFDQNFTNNCLKRVTQGTFL